MVDSLQNDIYPPEVIFNEDGTVKNGFGCLTAVINRCKLGEHVDYDIQLKHPSGSTWCVTRRYREFRALRDSLQERYNLPAEALAPFPPRKFFNNLSPDFVQHRSVEIETYLNSLLHHYTLPPPPLADFIDWNRYDIHGITNSLARQLTKSNENRRRKEPLVLCVYQLHSINARMKSPVRENLYNLPDEDFSKVVDFIAQVKVLKIYGSLEKLYNSNIAINSLTFDLSPFKSLDALELNNVEMGRMRGFETIKSTVTQLIVNRSLKNLNNFILGDLFAAGDGRWVFGEDPVKTVPWNCIKMANFSNNFLNKIDQTIALLPNIEILHLSSNLLTYLPDFTSLTRLRVLFLSDNQLYIKEEPNFPAVEVIEDDCGIPEAIVISSASVGTTESGGNRSISPNKPLPPLCERLGEVQILILANNGLHSASLVEGIFSLQHLDLSGNKIESFDELACLGELPQLNSLKLQGNPICDDPYYRRNVLNILGPRFPLIVLDDQRVTAKECENVRLYQALMRGGAVTQHSSNPPVKESTRSGEHLAIQLQNPASADASFAEKQTNEMILSQDNVNAEVSTNTSEIIDEYNCPFTTTLAKEGLAQVTNIQNLQVSSLCVGISSDQPVEITWDFSNSEIDSNSRSTECSIGKINGVTSELSGLQASDGTDGSKIHSHDVNQISPGGGASLETRNEQ